MKSLILLCHSAVVSDVVSQLLLSLPFISLVSTNNSSVDTNWQKKKPECVLPCNAAPDALPTLP